MAGLSDSPLKRRDLPMFATKSARAPLAVTLTLTTLLAACSTIPKAPEGSPRIEVELALEIDEPFVEPLQLEDKKALAASFDQTVLDRADVGLRFYPVLSELYESDDQRPPYLLTVVARDLEVEYEFKTKKGAEGEEPEVITELSSLRCNVTATLERRRQGRPPLPVARSKQEIHWNVNDPEAGVDTYPLKPIEEGDEALAVAQDDVTLGLERAVNAALKGLVESIDRELSLTQPVVASEE